MNKEKISQKIDELLKKMLLNAEVKVEVKDKTIVVEIDCQEPGLLIGFQGETMKALEHIIKIMLYNSQLLDSDYRFSLDINKYQEEKTKMLEDYIKNSMDKVLRSQKPEVLRTMNSFERRLSHTTISENEQLETESIGEEPNRRIVVRIKK